MGNFPTDRKYYWDIDLETKVPFQTDDINVFETHIRVGYVELENDVNVSTVFLRLDHNFFGEGPPILFETMIFGGPLDGYQLRYATWEEAEEGHEKAIECAIAANIGAGFRLNQES